jgi:DNA-binding Lrp family transcriptional regulator
MELDDRDLGLVSAIADGLPLVARPFQALGAGLGLSEAEVLERLAAMRESGIIRRFGIIVRHHELGFRANAMVVWDIPDQVVGQVGALLGAQPEVTLCYRRPRRLPDWPYNLFCMVHGRDRNQVTAAIGHMVGRLELWDFRHDVLFSLKRFKQTGARYGRRLAAE